jgi:hypothetical protein
MPFKPAVDTIRIAEEVINATTNKEEACTLALCVLVYTMDKLKMKLNITDLSDAIDEFPGLEAVHRAANNENEPVGAKMPDGTVLTSWDERLRTVGGVPLYKNDLS